MSWNGSGVYSRGYPSWSADAAANLPISSTKFDTEDNDFASGIGLCLTKDGQSVPNAALTWGLTSGQVLALTRGSDGAVFSATRTGGTNNPGLTITLTDASGVVLSVLGNSALSLSNAGVVSFPSGIGSLTGPITIAAPASGTALEVQAASGYQGLDLNAAAGAAYQTFSLGGTAQGFIGVANTSNALIVGAAANDLCLHSGPAGSAINFSVNYGSSIAASIAATGRVTIAAPSSGTTLTVNVAAGASAAIFGDTTGATTQQVYAGPIAISVGTFIETGYAELISTIAQPFYIGTNQNTSVNLATQSISRLIVDGGGGVYLQSATGGTQGAGTFNAQGLYINGAQIFSGVPASSNTTAALTDRNKCINATGTITVPNSTFSQGDAFSIYNNSSSAISISASVSTMRLAGTTTTGSRTLAPRGMATVWFESGTECIVGGPGVT